ncbi:MULTISPECIES: nucleoside triphosphate pyrophosphatase [unclassified Vibrio]|uniref:dTTP/UTP pyrophosphatase n=1 Tax=Vibrio sp. HB236076 TaxID=3232307 RepID=A0AB39HG48_9VIBR|nr:nucleoside triphosphate pyrophosphatase [Vibrio sp. HB161653]MDP5254386.1 nucleoside triphosphate pyrophosphatase [Vibrio sp. HB161653]
MATPRQSTEAPTLVLASSSPRRQQMLSQLGYQFEVCAPDIEERRCQGESPQAYVLRLAQQKAQAGQQQYHALYAQQSESDNHAHNGVDAVVLGSDTLIALGDQVFEKPRDLEHSYQILKQLSGTVHQVLTAVSVVQGQQHHNVLVTTKVWFKSLSRQEIEQYWQSGEPCDKAGSYAIQGLGGRFVTHLEGSYHAVVGLPLYETDQLLHRFLSK